MDGLRGIGSRWGKGRLVLLRARPRGFACCESQIVAVAEWFRAFATDSVPRFSVDAFVLIRGFAENVVDFNEECFVVQKHSDVVAVEA